MADVTIFLRGDQIGTYANLQSGGNGNDVFVSLGGVQPLGSETDVFRVVIRQVNGGTTNFSNGQRVDIYAYPDSTTPPQPLYRDLNPQHDQFQGRASSAEHQVFTNQRIVFDVDGVTPGRMDYGPGAEPPRNEQLPFNAFPSTPPAVPCFVAGTLIDTASGPRAIETLRPGDPVRTLDNGLQPLRWIGVRQVTGLGSFAPVRIAAGALDNTTDLWVSSQHRMLLRSWRAELMTGAAEVLVAAKHLVNGDTIRLQPSATVTYVHIAFERHEIVFAAGIPSESLFLGPVALDAVGRDARGELLAVFPELAGRHWHSETARPCLRSWETALIHQ